jgi:metallophosphoesterase (TIGR00282 family)
MVILFLGDIVGKPGRDAVVSCLPSLKADYKSDMVIANAENAAGGWGITPPIARQLLGAGVDVITLGNHTWAKTDGFDVIDAEPRILRPANYPPGSPGRGCGLFKASCGVTVGVANLNGRIFMEPLDDPFRMAESIIDCIAHAAKVIIFDFHAETTSEKQAFGWHCDGKVSAVIGTHTHVPTADERVLPGGAAYITDAGMCGPENSVIGMEVETAISRFTTQMPHKFRVAEGKTIVCGVAIDIDEETGKARSIERFCRRD